MNLNMNMAMDRNMNMKNIGIYDDQQDSFFADISSLSSSLMAKDTGNDVGSGDGDRSKNLSTNSYENLRHGMESSLSLFNGFGNSLRDELKGNDRTSSLSSLQQPPPGLTILAGSGPGSVSGLGSISSSGLGSGSVRGVGIGIGGSSSLGISGLGAGVGGINGTSLGMVMGTGTGIGISQGPELNSMSTEETEEEVTLLAAQQERAQFPSEFIDKLVAVLKRCGADGLLGSQFPEAFKKLHGEKLVLENKKGIFIHTVCNIIMIFIFFYQ